MTTALQFVSSAAVVWLAAIEWRARDRATHD